MNSTTPVSVVGAGALMALAAIVSGCSQNALAQNGGLGSRYCSPFKATPDNSAATLNTAANDPAAAFDDCIHRWGYALAPARDPADVVAQAAVNACGPIIAMWSQQATPEPSYRGRGRQSQAPMSPQAQQIRMAESRALFYVVQARAAGCAAPPPNTLLAYNAATANPNGGNPNPNAGNPYANPNGGNPTYGNPNGG